MFDDQSISYLSTTVADNPHQQSKAVQLNEPTVNTAINMQNNARFQSYPERADIAPYMSSYTKPPSLHQHQIDVLGDAGSNGTSSFKTGLLLSSLLLVGSVAGYSLEKVLKKQIKAKGYGAILGSFGAIGIYYVTAKSFSSGSVWEGVKAAGGFALPMLPIFVSMYQGKSLDRTTALISAGIGALGSTYVIVTNINK